MSLTTLDKGKGKAIAEEEVVEQIEEVSSSASDSASDSDSDSDSDTSEASESEDEITQEQLDALLAKARHNAEASAFTSQQAQSSDFAEEDVIHLDDEKEQPLPPLNSGALPTPYIELEDVKKGTRAKLHDLEVERVEKSSATAIPTPPAPPSAVPLGKTLTKKEKKALKTKTAGASWFDLPAPDEAELPKLYREVEALRLRNQLDPKRFYRREEGEGKGIKGLPKYFAIGTIVEEKTPFGTASADNLSKSQRKRTLVDELVDDAEAKSYAKKKFKDLQTVRGARGRGTLARKQAARKPKW